MPELPEVETIRVQLNELLSDRKVEDVTVLNRKSFIGEPVVLHGVAIDRVERYGKMLLIRFSSGISLAVHLKMTGQLLYRPQSMSHNMDGDSILLQSLPNSHTRIIISFSNNHLLFFNDIRKFGWMKIITAEESEKIRKSIGPDPLSQLTGKKLHTMLQSSNRPVKLVLMDQQKIAGIGNIYANDALFLAGIHPKTQANTLTSVHAMKLLRSIIKVLTDGIRYKGASRTNFLDVYGQKGSVQEHFHVYDREGIPCPSGCGTQIKRIKIGGRGTFFCPTCQR